MRCSDIQFTPNDGKCMYIPPRIKSIMLVPIQKYPFGRAVKEPRINELPKVRYEIKYIYG